MQNMQTSGNHFIEVVWRNICGHAHGNARRAINEQIRHFGRQNQGFVLAAIVIRAKINGFFI